MQLGQTEKYLSTQAEVPLLEPGHTYGSITDKIGVAVLLKKSAFVTLGGLFACGCDELNSQPL